MTSLTRNYSMSDSDLCVFTSNLANTITRDQAQFTIRGVTAAMVTTFKSLGNAFEILPSDSYYWADYLAATETKSATRDQLTIKLRSIMGYVKIKWGASSTQVKRFDAGDMTKQDDKKFLTTCRMAVRIANDYLTQLTSIGLTAAMITDLDTTSQTFEDNLNSIATAQANRDIKTQERITKGNELYALVSHYCEIGKIIWFDLDPAKYNDYVIYESTTTTLAKPQNLTATGLIGSPLNYRLSWDLVINATNYDIYSSIVPHGAPVGTYSLINNVSTNQFDVSAIVSMRSYIKIKAKNSSQSSDFSDEIWIEG